MTSACIVCGKPTQIYLCAGMDYRFHCADKACETGATSCKHYEDCANAACPYYHPYGARRPGLTRKCEYGDKCYKVNCPWQHPSGKERSSLNCRNGAQCTKLNCPYRHSTSSSSSSSVFSFFSLFSSTPPSPKKQPHRTKTMDATQTTAVRVPCLAIADADS